MGTEARVYALCQRLGKEQRIVIPLTVTDQLIAEMEAAVAEEREVCARHVVAWFDHYSRPDGVVEATLAEQAELLNGIRNRGKALGD
jgi:hypothetical protein